MTCFSCSSARLVALAILCASFAYAKEPDKYKIVSYCEKTPSSSAVFTILHNGVEIEAACGTYYGTNGECVKLRARVGVEILEPEMHFLSIYTLIYRPIGSGQCEKDACEFLHILSQKAAN